MISNGETQQTFTKRFNALRNRYRGKVVGTFAVLSTLAFIAAQFFPAVGDFVFKTGLIQYLIFLIVLDVALAIHPDPGTTQLLRNQDESMPRLIQAVHLCQSESVDLLEYAGATTLPLIREVRRERVPIRMLVKHPDTVIGFQRDRMITSLDTIFNSIFSDYRGAFEVRCYRQPFNLRARRLGNKLLELGWLTVDMQRQTAYGHGNPSVLVDLSKSGNHYLLEFFTRTFNDLWDATDTEDARAVLARLQPKT